MSFFEIVNDLEERKKIAAEMFKNVTLIYEPNTDLEATLDTLFSTLDIKKSMLNPMWDETRVSYEKFLLDKFDVFCGGLVEAFSLHQKFSNEGSADFFPFCTGKDLGVISSNGLITTQNFINKHFIVFRELVDTWFWSINQLREDIQNAEKSLIENIINFLNTSLKTTFTGTKVELSLSKELLDWMVNRGFEHFYLTPIEAFKNYYSDNNCQLLSNSFAFALLAPPDTSHEVCKGKYKQIGPMEFAKSLRNIVLDGSRKFLPEYHLGYSI